MGSLHDMNQYESTLKEVTDMFESCGCRAEVTAPSSSQVVLTVRGPASMCPISIFEEHVEKAKELMQASHADISFNVEVEEEGG